MELLTLIALAYPALTAGAVVGSAIGGVIGNRVDAAVVSGVKWLWGRGRQSSPETQQDLQRSIARAVLLAKQSIVQDCLKQRLSVEERCWLEEKGRSLQATLRKIDQRVFEVLDGDALAVFLVPEGDGVGVVKTLQEQLVQDAVGAPAIYGNLVRSDLFGRVCDRFNAEMAAKPVLQNLLQVQLLTQIRAEMPTAAELAEALQLPLESIQQGVNSIQKGVNEIRDILQPTPPAVPRRADFPENPFKPLSGRIEDPALFLAQDVMLREVFDLLKAGSSVALVGEKGLGKSSLLKEMARVSQDQLRRQAVYVDWNLVHNEKTFWGVVCDQIRVPYCTNSELVKALQSRRLLLLLDEVEKMERQEFGEEIRSQLRGLAQGDQMKVVVAACVSLDVLFPGEVHSLISLFNGLCTEVRMLCWSEVMVRNYIDQRLQPTPVRFTFQEGQEIYRQSQGNPQKLVRHCYNLYKARRDYDETR